MSPINIILIVFVFVLLYFIYRIYLYYSRNIVAQNAIYLQNGGVTIDATKINKVSSTSSSISIWVYLNSFNTSSTKQIFSIGGGVYTMYIDSTSPVLKFDVKMNSGIAPSSFVITNSFPIQKWVNVFVNINNNNVFEFYLNGKLVSTYSLNGGNVALISSSAGAGIQIGGSQQPPDIVVTNFIRWPKTTFAPDVWKNYLAGNGTSLFNYNAALSVTQNDTIVNYMSLFNISPNALTS